MIKIPEVIRAEISEETSPEMYGNLEKKIPGESLLDIPLKSLEKIPRGARKKG